MNQQLHEQLHQNPQSETDLHVPQGRNLDAMKFEPTSQSLILMLIGHFLEYNLIISLCRFSKTTFPDHAQCQWTMEIM